MRMNRLTEFQRRVLWRLDFLVAASIRLIRMEALEMAALDDLTREVEETKTVQASAITLITGLAQQLRDAIAAGNPQALTDLANKLDASATSLADAVVANTPV